MQPPWSTATSTITEPAFISFRSSRRTSFGAFAPGSSTAPITTSALRNCSSRLWRVGGSQTPVGARTAEGEGDPQPRQARRLQPPPPAPPPLPAGGAAPPPPPPPHPPGGA